MNNYQTYIALSRYAKYLMNEERRETWQESVKRYCDYWKEKYEIFPYELVYNAMLKLEVMPSMRALMTAGKALDRDNAAGYNCSYLAIDDPRAFDEAMYLLMCGCGVGFSVERQFINKLPSIPEELFPTDTVLKVKDSKIGWASAFKELVSLLYSGSIPAWDLSALRPAGAPLKTFGGRSSGPGPLEDLFKFVITVFKEAAGRKLNSIECHDIMCKIGEIVVVGGVRRSAMISLSNLSDDRLRDAKMGQWWIDNVQRALSNNSVAYTEIPDIGQFMKEWKALYDSKSGERGIFNRLASIRKAKENGRRDWEVLAENAGTNPCGEISLRSMGFCNLTEAVIRESDDIKSLEEKVKIAAIIGTFQSTLTNFRYLRKQWKKNASEERLLGVSLTGIMDNQLTSNRKGGDKLTETLKHLKQVVIDTNKEWADKLSIEQSVATTTVKPSGTVSQLVDSASGIHGRYSRYYIRTVRNDKKDPLSDFLIQQGVPYESDITKPESTWVFSFPMKAPSNAVLANELTAIDQLEMYKLYNTYWAEHNVSITVYVKENEWMEVGAWVYKNFESINGVSFLPYSEHSYKQAPYQPINKEEFEKLNSEMPTINWDDFKIKEIEDNTHGAQQFACVGGVCELV
jgi:ribonucleoside-triphosphate reductase